MFTLGESSFSTVTVGAQTMALPMVRGRQYRFTSSVDCYIRVTQAAGGAAAAGADGSHLVMASQQVLVGQLGIDGSANVLPRDRISVIRVGGSDGVCTLSEIATVPNG